MKISLIAILLIFAILVESLWFQLPLFLIALLLLTVFWQKEWVLLIAIGGGIVLDSLAFRPLGVSSIFFVVMVGLIFAYGKKFEIQSAGFVVFVSTIATCGYIFLFATQHLLLQIVLTILLAVFCFIATLIFQEKIPSVTRFSLDQ